MVRLKNCDCIDRNFMRHSGNRGMYCWGSNPYGQLGIDDAAISQSSIPVQVGGDSDWFGSVLASGDAHTCAVKTNGKIYCCGYNQYG